ncbi:MAG: porin family protein [Verrucomicrobiales bacterium]|nr:porin family protein [Verrucomicrobiales bacterium]
MKNIAITLALLFLSVQAASAQDSVTLSHSYFDFGYERIFYVNDLGERLNDANGLVAELSIAPTEHFFLLGEYHYAKSDTISDDDSVSTQDLRLGLGLNAVLAGIIDIYVQGGVRYMETGPLLFFDRIDDLGLYFEPGIRMAVIPLLEVYLSADYTRIDERNLFGVEIGTVIKFTDLLGVEISSRVQENRASLGIGARLQW